MKFFIEEPITQNCQLADLINRRLIIIMIYNRPKSINFAGKILSRIIIFILQFPGEFIEHQLKRSHK